MAYIPCFRVMCQNLQRSGPLVQKPTFRLVLFLVFVFMFMFVSGSFARAA